MRNLIYAALAAFLIPFAGHSQMVFGTYNEDSIAFGEGEKLTFVVSYSAKLVPTIDAGEVVFRTNKENVGSIPTYHVYANAKVFSHFKWFYDLDDTYQTWMDQSGLIPVKHQYRLREAKFRANCDYTYNWDKMQVTTYYHNLKRPEGRTRVLHLNKGSYDAIGLFYNLRSQDLSKFAVGSSNKLELVLDDTVRVVTFKMLSREQRKIGKLGTFKTIKFSCTLASKGESFEDGSEFFLWVSDDDNKIPLYLESPIKVGSVKVTLTKHSNLKHPLDSKVK